MSARIFSAALIGIDAQLIEVEVDSTPGLPVFNIVGLPDKAVEESKDRIASALKNSKLASHNTKHKKIIINLAPADLKKEGPSYDLPIAIAYLLETKQIEFDSDKRLFIGELSLDGSLKHTNGILSVAIMAKEKGFSELIVPEVNSKEAAVIGGLKVIGAQNILQVLGHLSGEKPIPETGYVSLETDETQENPLLYIQGQETAKRALMIAAAGGHNILMHGAPGSGKTLLAKALRYLLPPLSLVEAIDVARIYSSVGLIKDTPLSYIRPFRNPHHTTSSVAVVGGGTIPKPGEISLAHRGVLFLDELPEFARNVLESLRQPLEDGTVSVSRAAGSITLPAKFMLVAAMNPCPCGNYGDPINTCICPMQTVMKYKKKISGPLLDRIDIQIAVPRETVTSAKDKITPANQGKVEEIRQSIMRARAIQQARFAGTKIYTNSEMNHQNIDKYCTLSESAENLLNRAINSKGLSLRTYHKMKKLARTIADLDTSMVIQDAHVAEALSLKVQEKSMTDI